MPVSEATAAHPIRVLVVDADHRVRASLAEFLGCSDGIQVAGRAGDVAAAVAAVTDQAPDVVLIDPRLPDVDAGFALIGLLRRRMPRVRLLVLTSLGCERDALATGADAFLPKGVPPQDVVDAIVALARPGTAAAGA